MKQCADDYRALKRAMESLNATDKNVCVAAIVYVNAMEGADRQRPSDHELVTRALNAYAGEGCALHIERLMSYDPYCDECTVARMTAALRVVGAIA